MYYPSLCLTSSATLLYTLVALEACLHFFVTSSPAARASETGRFPDCPTWCVDLIATKSTCSPLSERFPLIFHVISRNSSLTPHSFSPRLPTGDILISFRGFFQLNSSVTLTIQTFFSFQNFMSNEPS